jgi:hypothetical protein
MAAFGIGGIDPSLLPPDPVCLIRYGRDNRHQCYSIYSVLCGRVGLVGIPVLRNHRFVKHGQRQSTTAFQCRNTEFRS